MVSIKRPIPNIKIHIQDRDLGSIIKKLKISAKKVEIDKPIEEKAVRICKEAVHKKLDFSFSEKAFIGGIIYTTTHTCGQEGGIGYALRFPRAVSFIRNDKGVEDVNTTHEIIEMFKNQKKVELK